MKKNNIAIIGGGLAGLITAYRLSQRDFRIALFEKEKELGGELGSARADNQNIEKFYHHFFPGNKHLLRLLKELNLDKNIRWHRGRMAVIRSGETHPFDSARDLLGLPFLPFPAKMRMGIGAVLTPLIDYRYLHRHSAEELVRKTQGNKAWEDFWRPIFRLKFDNHTDRISATWFWARLKERLSSRKGGEVLGYLEGGFQSLVDALEREIKSNGGVINCGIEVTEITKENGYFEINGESFDKVIATLPLPIFNRISPQKLQDVPHIGVAVALLDSSAPITDYYWTNVLDQSIPFGVIVEQSNLVKMQKNIVYLGRYLDTGSALWKMDDQKLTETFINSLEKLYPGSKAKISRGQLFRDPFAQPIITVNYKVPKFETDISNLYVFSAAHIYPYDRGLERVVSGIEALLKLLEQ